jgi:hypothetical protein
MAPRYTSKEALSAKAYACDNCGPDAHAVRNRRLRSFFG